MGQPSHIIIHTGSNKLRLKQERVAESVKRAAQRPTKTFPYPTITISTILPQRDLHPDAINWINADISLGWALMPNVTVRLMSQVLDSSFIKTTNLNKKFIICDLSKQLNTLIKALTTNYFSSVPCKKS